MRVQGETPRQLDVFNGLPSGYKYVPEKPGWVQLFFCLLNNRLCLFNSNYHSPLLPLSSHRSIERKVQDTSS